MDKPTSPLTAPEDTSLPQPANLDARRLGGLLLALYALARTESVEAFQQRTMLLLSGLIDFDGAWWGRGTVVGTHHHVTCSCRYNMPEDVADKLNTCDPQNLLAMRISASPNRAHLILAKDIVEHPSTAAFNEYAGGAQILCIARSDTPNGLTSFAAFVRKIPEPVFDAHDHELLEVLMPHLDAALDLCCSTQMAQMRRGGKEAMLTTDQEGWIQLSEPAARTLLCREWPAWTGPRLPSELVARLATRLPVFIGQEIRIDLMWSGEHALLTLNPRSPRDSLTRQEAAVAEAFSSGLSYRQVASRLELAPATVRHHLRSIYLKLGVADKAALAQALAP